MVKVDFEKANIAIIGSTKLTKKLVDYLESINRPKIIFGLADKDLKNKVNSINFNEICTSRKIILLKKQSWSLFSSICDKEKIDLIIEFGDSRIIPKNICEKYFIIGSHGAILPIIKGGASLVWGRMCNNLNWGVSLYQISQHIDEGTILNISKFNYEKNISMEDFIKLADDKTIECLENYITKKNLIIKKIKKSDYRLPYNNDSYETVLFALKCIKNNLSVYLPSRNVSNCKINTNWPKPFIDIFKIANNKPYTKFYY